MLEAAAVATSPMPAAAAAALKRAAGLWLEDEAAATEIRAALAAAPDHLDVLIGAYKFYFYKNRLEEAAPLALACVEAGARRLNLPPDWTLVQPGDAAFTALEAWPRFFLFALKAYGYVLARLGQVAEGRAAVAKVADLDPDDRTGSRRLLAVIDRGGVEPEED